MPEQAATTASCSTTALPERPGPQHRSDRRTPEPLDGGDDRDRSGGHDHDVRYADDRTLGDGRRADDDPSPHCDRGMLKTQNDSGGLTLDKTQLEMLRTHIAELRN